MKSQLLNNLQKRSSAMGSYDDDQSDQIEAKTRLEDYAFDPSSLITKNLDENNNYNDSKSP